MPFQLPGGCSDVSLISNDVGIERRHVLVGCLCIFLGEGLVQMHCPFSHEFVLFCFVSVVTELQELFVCSGYRSLNQISDLQVLSPALGVVFLLPSWCALKHRSFSL